MIWGAPRDSLWRLVFTALASISNVIFWGGGGGVGEGEEGGKSRHTNEQIGTFGNRIKGWTSSKGGGGGGEREGEGRRRRRRRRRKAAFALMNDKYLLVCVAPFSLPLSLSLALPLSLSPSASLARLPAHSLSQSKVTTARLRFPHSQ